jgi:hypothetical protein
MSHEYSRIAGQFTKQAIMDSVHVIGARHVPDAGCTVVAFQVKALCRLGSRT